MPIIMRRYHFESAHFLPKVPEGHRCRNMHGHNYKLDVCIHAEELNEAGFVVDFLELDEILKPILFLVDHHLLNEVPGLENPTAEIIAKWFFYKIDNRIKHLSCNIQNARIWENDDCSAVWYRIDQ